MKILAAAALVVWTGAGAHAAASGYPSCETRAQRAPGRARDGATVDIAARANILQADLGTARKARILTQAEADRLYARVETARNGADRLAVGQGFPNAGEVASYDRELEAVAMRICGPETAARSEAAIGSDSEYLQDRAASLDTRIQSATQRKEVSLRDAAALRLAVRQVQAKAGHMQAVKGRIDRPDADRMNQRLTDVERRLTRQP